MSRTILIYGQSGAGKTTSCRNLDPRSTCFIDCDGKGLSWQGWRKQFNAAAKNYMQCNSPDMALRALRAIDSNAPHIKIVVVDGISTLMQKEVFRRKAEKGYDKWTDLASYIFELVDHANHFRDDLTIVFIGHVDIERDKDGTLIFARLKTSGQMLRRIELESLFTTVLYAKTDDDEHHYFETVPSKSTAKSPIGALEPVIENDINIVIKQLDAYEGVE